MQSSPRSTTSPSPATTKSYIKPRAASVPTCTFQGELEHFEEPTELVPTHRDTLSCPQASPALLPEQIAQSVGLFQPPPHTSGKPLSTFIFSRVRDTCTRIRRSKDIQPNRPTCNVGLAGRAGGKRVDLSESSSRWGSERSGTKSTEHSTRPQPPTGRGLKNEFHPEDDSEGREAPMEVHVLRKLPG